MQGKDLHYFITRIINPDLNWIVVSLRSDHKVVYGRIGYTGVRWRDKTPGDYIADRLEEWRDNLWYKYKRDFPANGKEILDEYFRILYDAELAFYGSGNTAVKGMWELAKRMGEYLGLDDYVQEKKAEIRERVQEAMNKTSEPELDVDRWKGSRTLRPSSMGTPNRDYEEVLKTPPSRPFHEGSRISWKSAVAVVLGILLIGVLWAAARGMITVPTFSAKSADVSQPIILGNTTVSSSEESTTSTASYIVSTSTSSTSTWQGGEYTTTESSEESPCIGAAYSLGKALKCYLNKPSVMDGLRNLALQLKRDGLVESAWSVVEWEDTHISYDYIRASNPMSTIQTPLETVQRGKGVCSDYALLAVALLIEMNYSPVYVFEINFSNDPIGHATAAIKVNGSYFMIDQHPPIMDLGTYWKDWAYWRNVTTNGTEKNLLISKAVVYEIRKTPSGVVVEPIGTLTAQDFKREDYTFTHVDVQRIVSDLRAKFLSKYHNLHLDERIANLDSSRYLPYGYSDGRTWITRFPYFGEYYNPVFHKEFVDYLYRHLVDSPSLVGDLKKYTSFWLKATVEANNTLKVTINLASK